MLKARPIYLIPIKLNSATKLPKQQLEQTFCYSGDSRKYRLNLFCAISFSMNINNENLLLF